MTKVFAGSASQEPQSLRWGKLAQISDRYFPNPKPAQSLAIGESAVLSGVNGVNHFISGILPSNNIRKLYTTAGSHSLQLISGRKEPKVTPAQNTPSVTNSNTRFPEASNTLIAQSRPDVIEHSPSTSTGRLWLISHAYVLMTLWTKHAHSQPRSSFPRWTTLPRNCVPFLSTVHLRMLPPLPTDVQTTSRQISTLRCQEVDHSSPNLSQASSCAPPHQPPSGAAALFGFGDIDDETRDAVLRLIWKQNEAYDVAAGVTHSRTYWLRFTW